MAHRPDARAVHEHPRRCGDALHRRLGADGRHRATRSDAVRVGDPRCPRRGAGCADGRDRGGHSCAASGGIRRGAGARRFRVGLRGRTRGAAPRVASQPVAVRRVHRLGARARHPCGAGRCPGAHAHRAREGDRRTRRTSGAADHGCRGRRDRDHRRCRGVGDRVACEPSHRRGAAAVGIRLGSTRARVGGTGEPCRPGSLTRARGRRRHHPGPRDGILRHRHTAHSRSRRTVRHGCRRGGWSSVRGVGRRADPVGDLTPGCAVPRQDAVREPAAARTATAPARRARCRPVAADRRRGAPVAGDPQGRVRGVLRDAAPDPSRGADRLVGPAAGGDRGGCR